MVKKRIHLIYGILVSVSAVIAGICLILACVKLYNFQPGSFSRESVAAAFQPIAIPVYLCLILVIGSIVLNLVCPVSEEKHPVEKQYGTILKKLQEKVDITKCEPDLFRSILRQRTARMIHTIVSIALLIICSSVFLLYSLDKNHYSSDANIAVVQAMKYFFPCLLIPFAYSVFTAFYQKHSIRKEIDLLKLAIADGAKTDSPAPAPTPKSGTTAKVFRYVILGVALCILIGGFIFGGTADVLAKAAAICTECVGLG